MPCFGNAVLGDPCVTRGIARAHRLVDWAIDLDHQAGGVAIEVGNVRPKGVLPANGVADGVVSEA